MSTAKNTTVLYVIIAVLVMCLAASIGYTIGNGTSTQNASKADVSMNAINSKVLKEIEELKTIYDSKIAEKKATYKDLEAEKEKVQTLLAELEQTKGDANALLKYKEEYQNLEAKMMVLVDEIGALKANKTKAVTKKAKKAKPVLTESRKPQLNARSFAIKNQKKSTAQGNTKEVKREIVELVQPKIDQDNSEIAKQIVERKEEKVYENLYASNIRATVYTSQSGEQTNLASKANLIKVNFSLSANENARAGEKRYFIQVVDGNNKVMGKRITEFFDDKSITYSSTKTIQYENQYLPISQEVTAAEFAKGTYTVNIYERSRLVGKTTFALR